MPLLPRCVCFQYDPRDRLSFVRCVGVIMRCCVCESGRAVYKCRLCREPYCSAGCFSKHREGCTRSGQNTELPTQTPPPQPAAEHREANHDDGELTVLRTPHLAALANDAKVREMLKSEELRKLLATIDSSRSRLDALTAAQHNIPEFRDFCRRILHVVDAAE